MRQFLCSLFLLAAVWSTAVNSSFAQPTPGNPDTLLRFSLYQGILVSDSVDVHVFNIENTATSDTIWLVNVTFQCETPTYGYHSGGQFYKMFTDTLGLMPPWNFRSGFPTSYRNSLGFNSSYSFNPPHAVLPNSNTTVTNIKFTLYNNATWISPMRPRFIPNKCFFTYRTTANGVNHLNNESWRFFNPSP